MAKYACRYCGGDNEVPLSAETAVREAAAELRQAIEAIPGKLPAPEKIDLAPVIAHLDKVGEHRNCAEHPEQCGLKPKLDESQAEATQLRKKVDELEHSHQVLTADYVAKQYESCPNCKAGLEDWFKRETEKRMPKVDKPAYTPPWKRKS